MFSSKKDLEQFKELIMPTFELITEKVNTCKKDVGQVYKVVR